MSDFNYTDKEYEFHLIDVPEEEAALPSPEEAPVFEESDAIEDQMEFSFQPAAGPVEVTEEPEVNETLAYYNANAENYYERTVSSDMQAQYDFFLKYVPSGARILDLGCGSGRDSKYFMDKGFLVTPLDGSEAMCKKAESYTGLSVRQMEFLDLNDREIYSGIWASASLLHLEKKDLGRMFAKLRKALTRDGILYVSFRKGNFDGMRNGRHYTDLTEGELFNLVNTVGGMKIVQAKEFKEERDEETITWICAIIKKW